MVNLQTSCYPVAVMSNTFNGYLAFGRFGEGQTTGRRPRSVPKNYYLHGKHHLTPDFPVIGMIDRRQTIILDAWLGTPRFDNS